jgi:hypothetical protein
VALHEPVGGGNKEVVDVSSASPGARRIVETLGIVGIVGMTARGAIFALIGYFIVQAAVTFDPQHAKGIDGVLKSLAAEPFGPLLLAVTAGGLAAFGVFSLIEVRYARTS